MGYNRVICTRPYDCEIEYLESTGTQWIDTRIVSQNNLVYDFKVEEPQLNDQKAYFGFKEGSGWLTAGMNDGNWGQDEWTGWIYADFASNHTRCIVEYPNRSGIYHFDFTDGNASASLNGTTFWTSDLIGTYNGSRHVYIYYMDWDEDNVYNRKAVIKIYYFQIRKNGNLLFDGIPVRKGNEGYIYDRVSGKLFGNKGTGSFVLGNDIPNTAPTIRHVVYTTPYDSEVEYLESVANSTYIDTLLKPSNNIDCEILAQRSRVTVTTDAIFGGGIGYGSSYAVIPHKNTEIIISYGNDSEYIATNNCFAQPWVVKNVGGKFYINNTEYELSPSTEEWTLDYNIYLFAWNYGGSANRQTKGYIRIYYAKFWDNGVLVRDFIPVRKGSIGYLYDKVSGKLFANQGTGNFILGNDVANPVPKIRRVIPMPYDSKIEYLESTGTQWINTDTIINSLDSISVTLQFTQSNAPACIFNARNTNPIKNTISLFRMENNSLRFDYGKTQVSKNVSGVNFSIKHEYKSVANKLYVDDVLKATNTDASFTAGKSVMVLAAHNVTTNLVSNFAYAKLYSVKIINSNNEVLRDLIPVRRGNVGYLYDKVSGKLFGNAGTGQFILGNDIND